MSEWEKLKWKTLDCLEEIPRTRGVYAVRSMRAGKPRVIGGAFGEDRSGILCFGTTKKRTLRERLGEFRRAVSGRAAPHAEGKTYYRLKYSENGYPLLSLEIAWISLTTQGQARQQEQDWLRTYEGIFGELPPLNKQCG